MFLITELESVRPDLLLLYTEKPNRLEVFGKEKPLVALFRDVFTVVASAFGRTWRE